MQKSQQRHSLARRGCVVLALIWSLHLVAEESPSNVLNSMLYGIPADLQANEFESAKQLVALSLTELDRTLEANSHRRTDNCRRFNQLTQKSARQLVSAIRKVQSDSSDRQLMIRTRLHVLIPSFFGLHALFLKGAEGGYSTLDPNRVSPCSWGDRALVEGKFTQAVEQLAYFHRRGLGNPGLVGFDEVNDRLLSLMDEQEVHRHRIMVGMLVGTTVLSIFFWQFAPPVAMLVAQRTFGLSPTLIHSPTFAFTTRSLAFAGEGLAYAYLDRQINPPPMERHQNLTASWDEQLRGLEQLADSPFSAVEITLAYISQLQAQIVLLYRPWLEENLERLPQVGAHP